MTSVLRREGEKTRRRGHEGRGIGQRDASTSQGMPRMASSHQKPERGMEQLVPRSHSREPPWISDLQPPELRGDHLKPPACVTLLRQPGKLMEDLPELSASSPFQVWPRQNYVFTKPLFSYQLGRQEDRISQKILQLGRANAWVLSSKTWADLRPGL